MQLYEKLALIQFATRQFETLCALAQSSAPGALLARDLLAQAKVSGLHNLPYHATTEGYFGWVGKRATSRGVLPEIKFMFH